MSDDFTVQDTNVPTPARPEGQAPKGLYKLVIALGLAKDVNGARMILLGIAVVAIVVAIAYPLLFL